MKRKRFLLFLGAILVVSLVAAYLSREHIILHSGLYTIHNIDCHEAFSVSIDPADYDGLAGEEVVDQYIAERYDTIIKLEKISADLDRVNIFINLENKWDILHGNNMVLYTVVGQGKSRAFRYEPLDFSLTDSSGNKAAYSQYGQSGNTICISLDKDVFFGQEGKITVDFLLDKCIEYKLGA